MSARLFIFVIFTGFLTIAQAQTQIAPDWVSLHQNSTGFLRTRPAKFDQNGRPLGGNWESLFTQEEILSRQFLEKKIHVRKKLMGQSSRARSNSRWEGLANALFAVKVFLDEEEFIAKNATTVFSLKDIEARGLLEAKLPETPWSDSYWPYYQGALGARYSAQPFQSLSTNWRSFYRMVQGNGSLENILKRNDPDEIDQLSPAEKYDLLIGDPLASDSKNRMGFLTPGMWSEGERFMDSSGKVETWMGLCHGWAPASFMMPRPQRSIHAPSAAKGVDQIKFYPSDLKGLATLLWANGDTGDLRFFGGRCGTKTPKIDPETGKILEKECFDLNPAFWHFAIVNQIGVAKRAMVIDATYDYEVWNQPVFAYQINYFNPATGEIAGSIDDATVNLENYKNDKFARYRHPQTKQVVGIQMLVSYTIENTASHLETDDAAMDFTRTVRYSYDLEIDGKGDVIGGEWYINQHPDFVWMPTMHSQAMSIGDVQIQGDWTPDQPLPKFWRDVAVKTALHYHQPLAAIVHPMLKAANLKPDGADQPRPSPARPIQPERPEPPESPVVLPAPETPRVNGAR